MIRLDTALTPSSLLGSINRLWSLSGEKIETIASRWNPADGSPVVTRDGRYEPQIWTDWTLGFKIGSAILQFDATGDRRFLHLALNEARSKLTQSVTHFGVHDHGFNVTGVFGNLRRLRLEGRISEADASADWTDLALRASGAVQAHRWTATNDGRGFIYSFNGPHSLFADTIRTLRSLLLAHCLGQVLRGEGDCQVSLLERAIRHAHVTCEYAVFYGEGRDAYDDQPGRVAHESLFNPATGTYRCPATQQGYSPFTTWTRGQAWVLLGCAEMLEFLDDLSEEELAPFGNRSEVCRPIERAAEAVASFALERWPADGIPYWDTGAPGLIHLKAPELNPANPFNDHEPVDSSAAAILAQGLLRLAHRATRKDPEAASAKSWHLAGLVIARTLFGAPYLSETPEHEGLLLNTIYHRPNGWDYVPPNSRIPYGEAGMWGDYHLRELALCVERLAAGRPYLQFHGPIGRSD